MNFVFFSVQLYDGSVETWQVEGMTLAEGLDYVRTFNSLGFTIQVYNDPSHHLHTTPLGLLSVLADRARSMLISF